MISDGVLVALTVVLVALLVLLDVQQTRAKPGADRRHLWLRRAFMWCLAPVVEKWEGLSLTRFLAMGIFLATVDISHDWIAKCVEKSAPLGFSFTAFALLGFFLAVVTALGAKYIDKIICIVATKLGVALNDAPVPGLPHG